MNSSNAETVYFVARDYRYFSHTDRLNWFFEHVSSQKPIVESEDDVLVACALSEEGEVYVCDAGSAKSWGLLLQDDKPKNQKFLNETELRVTSQTRLHALACRYNFVFCLDMSPSMASLDPLSGIFLLDHLRKVMEKCLQELVAEVKIGKFTFVPEIFVSVLALGTADQFKVLFQGIQLRSETLKDTLRLFAREFSLFENEIAAQRRDQSQQNVSNTQQQSGSGSDLGAMIQMSMLALNLLPAGSCCEIVLLTDGVTSLPEHTSYDSLITSLNRADIACHIIEITGSSAPIYASLGLLPDRDVLEFLAKRSRGALVDCHKLLAEQPANGSVPPEDFLSPRTEAVLSQSLVGSCGSTSEMTEPSSSAFETQFSTLQFPLLVKQFSSTGTTLAAPNDTLGAIVDTPWIVSDGTNINSLSAIDHAYPWDGEPPPVTVMHTPVLSSYDLQLDLVQVIQLRVREGFNISDVTLLGDEDNANGDGPEESDVANGADDAEGDGQRRRRKEKLSVKVTLEWQPSVRIEYHVFEKSLSGRIGASASALRVEISVFAHYDFYAALIAAQQPAADAASAEKMREKLGGGASSSAAAAAVAPLQSFLSTVAKTDRLLTHLLQHAGAICSLGIPSAPSSSATEMLNVLWNSITYLNISSLHKWFPEETLTLLLKQDDLVAKVSGTEGRELSLTSVSYAEATAALLSLMEKLATYSAPQNKLYLLLFTESGSLKNSNAVSSAQSSSSSLILIRPVWQSRNIVSVHIFFLYGCLATTRRGVLQNVCSKLGALVSEQRLAQPVALSAASAGVGAPLAPAPGPLERMPSVPTLTTKPTAHRRSLSVSGNGAAKSPRPAPTPPPSSSSPAPPSLVSICAKPILSLLVRYEDSSSAPSAPSADKIPTAVSSNLTGASSASSASGSLAAVSAASTSVTLSLAPLTVTQPKRESLQVRYLKHQRWTFKMLSTQSCETLLQLLLLTRLEEGFTLVPISPNTLTFYKEFLITGTERGQRMLSSVQCVLFFASPLSLVVEVWIEPQLGKLNAVLEEVSAQIGRWLNAPNVMLSNALTSFDVIAQAIGGEANKSASAPSSAAVAAGAAPGTILAQLTSAASGSPLVQRVSLVSVASQAPRVLEHYPVFSSGGSLESLVSANQNLYVFFESSVRSSADCEFEVTDEDARELLQENAPASSNGNSWKCFCKKTEEDRAVLVLLARPSYVSSAPPSALPSVSTTSSSEKIPPPTWTSTTSSSEKTALVSSSSNSSGSNGPSSLSSSSALMANVSAAVVCSPLLVHFFELSRSGWKSTAIRPSSELQQLFGIRTSTPIAPAANSSSTTVATPYRTFLRELHQVHFGQGAYSRLRDPVQPIAQREDLIIALPLSRETMQTEVDVTQFLSILRKYQDAPTQPESNTTDPLKEAQRRFLAATSQWSPLPIALPRLYNSQAGKVREGGPSEAPDDQVYFYFKPNSEKEDLPLLPLLEGQLPPPFFSNALYLHMELIATTAAGSPAVATAVGSTFPVNPQTYSKAVLRLILHSLPDKSTLSPRSASAPPAAATKYLSSLFGSLRTKLQEVVYAEILDSLRHTRPITKQTLNTVLHHLNSLPPGSLRSLTLSLSFFDMKEGRKQFPLYLHRSSSLKLVRFGDVYLWIEPVGNTAVSSAPPVTASVPPTASLKDSSAVAGGGSTEDTEAAAVTGNYNIPYWLILTHQMQEDTVTALLYSYSLPHSEKTQIFKQVRQSIAEICFTINQYCLLNQLHDTRVAPELLIPKDEETEQQPTPSASSSSSSVSAASAAPSTSSSASSVSAAPVTSASTTVVSVQTTTPGEEDEIDQPLLVEGKGSYGCKCVDEISLPLNKRLTSQAAIRGVIGSTLHPFSVANRRNTFVYREQSGNVFYLRLTESTSSKTKSSCLVLRVYGMTAPSQEITQQLYQLLENKLIAITLAIISNLLTRNPLLKLTEEDIEFLRPAGEKSTPARHLTFYLPQFVSAEMSLFAAFLRTNLMLFLSQLHRDLSGVDSSSSSSASSPDEKTFLYNYIQEGPAASSSLFTHIGQGIALISTDLSAPSTPPTKGFSAPEDQQDVKKWIAQLLPDDLSKPNEARDQATLTFDVWVRGSLNVDTLVDILTARVHQTLCDLALEVGPMLQSPAKHLGACKAVLKRAHSHNSPAVQHSKVSLVLSSWDMKAALAEMGSLLLEVNPKLAASFFFTPNRKKEKNFSPISEIAQLDPLRLHLQKNGSSFLVVGGKYPKEPLETEFSKNESMFYAHVKSDSLTHFRMSTVFLFVRTHKLTVLSYNLSPSAWEQVQILITRLASWKTLRSHLLSAIVHQKCNLFHHLPNVSLTEPLPPPPASRNFVLSGGSNTSGGGGGGTANAVSRGETQTAVKFSLESIDLLLHSAPARTKGPTSAVALAAAAGVATPSAVPSSSSASSSLMPGRGGRPMMTSASQAQAAAAAAAAQKRPPQSHAPAFGDVFKSLPAVSLPWSPFASLPDPLLRHALHFKQAATELTVRNKQRATLRQLFWQIWGAGKNTSTLTGPFVKAVLAAARFVHVSSAPYALNTLKDETIAVSSGGVFSSSSAAGKKPGDLVYFPDSSTPQAAQEWRESFAQEIQMTYASYLENVHGCVLLRPDAQLSSKKTYLQKVFTSSMVLLELSVSDENFVRVQMHHLLRGTRDDPNKLQSSSVSASAASAAANRVSMTRNSSSGGNLSAAGGTTQLNPSAAPSLASASLVGVSTLPNWEEVNLLRAQLHLHSFLYDLSLRRFQNFLIAPPLSSSAHDYVRSLHTLHSYYSTRPMYSRNLLFASSLSLELNRLDELSTVSPFDMFSYISTHSTEYGWKNLEAHGKGLKPALYYSPLHLPSNASPGSIAPEVINYSIVAFFSPLPTTPTAHTSTMSPLPAAAIASSTPMDYPVHTTLLNVQYYVIIVSSNPLPMTQTELITLSARKEEQEALVAEEVRRQLVQALEEGITDYRKDHLWRKLESSGGGSGRGITAEQLRALTSLAYPREVHQIDPTLTRLFGGTPVLSPNTAQGLYTLLAKAYADRVCYQQRDGNPFRLVIMTKPTSNQSRALLLDLQLFNSGVMKLILYARNQSDMITQQYERHEISTLVNRILAWMWRDLFFRAAP